MAAAQIPVRVKPGATLFEVEVSPGSKVEGVVGLAAGALRIAVRAPAQEGRANAALLKLMSAALGVPQSRLRLVRGKASKRKVLAVRGLTAEALELKLREMAGT